MRLAPDKRQAGNGLSRLSCKATYLGATPCLGELAALVGEQHKIDHLGVIARSDQDHFQNMNFNN